MASGRVQKGRWSVRFLRAVMCRSIGGTAQTSPPAERLHAGGRAEKSSLLVDYSGMPLGESSAVAGAGSGRAGSGVRLGLDSEPLVPPARPGNAICSIRITDVVIWLSQGRGSKDTGRQRSLENFARNPKKTFSTLSPRQRTSPAARRKAKSFGSPLFFVRRSRLIPGNCAPSGTREPKRRCCRTAP
jgi:hypothetical protein